MLEGKRGIIFGVANDTEIKAVFEAVGKKWGSIDFWAHAVAFANREDLKRWVGREEVGEATLSLLSGLSSGVAGEIHYVDAGFSVIAA